MSYSLIDRVLNGANLLDDDAPVVLEGSPESIAALHFDNVVALMIVYRDGCPFCRALERTLIDAVDKMIAHNRTIDKRTQNRYALMLYDTKKPGNDTFSAEQLRIRAVPSYFILHHRDGKVVIQNWENARLVETAHDNVTGALKKEIPVDVLLHDLSAFATQDAKQQRKLKFAETRRRQRQLKKSASLI